MSYEVSSACFLPWQYRIDTTIAAMIICVLSVAWYSYHQARRSKERLEIGQLRADLRELQEKLRSFQSHASIIHSEQGLNNEIRIFMDGAFDLLHFGHMNAFRLARSLGTKLIVGVNSDESITECKGPPLMNNSERMTMIQACKFVDEVVPECPYIMNEEYLQYVLKEYEIDFVVHGDDPCIVDGKDVYETAKQAGIYRSIPRTENVSTTNIIGRILQIEGDEANVDHFNGKVTYPKAMDSIIACQSTFLTTCQLLQLFSEGFKMPVKGARVVYIDGCWDLFHPGHVEVLKAARMDGDFLLVGVFGDAVAHQIKGRNMPVMNLHERVLGVSGCRHVDDVLIDAPYEISANMIASLGITNIICSSDDLQAGNAGRLKHAIEAGINLSLKCTSDFRIQDILGRIRSNHDSFQAKYRRKMQGEKLFYDEKHSKNASSNKVSREG